MQSFQQKKQAFFCFGIGISAVVMLQKKDATHVSNFFPSRGACKNIIFGVVYVLINGEGKKGF